MANIRFIYRLILNPFDASDSYGLLLIVQGIFIGCVLSMIFKSFDNQLYYKDTVEINQTAVDEVFDKVNQIKNINNTIDDYKVAENLHDNIRILCMIMTETINHHEKAIHIKNTWGKRCNTLLFMSDTEDQNLGSIAIIDINKPIYLWRKLRLSYKYVFDNYYDNFDWVLRTNDHSYVIMENLRYFLNNLSSTTPIYFGLRMYKYENFYAPGGAGVVLSKMALYKLISEGFTDMQKCNLNDSEQDDVFLGECLQRLNVFVGDSRDLKNRHRFLPFAPEFNMYPVEEYLERNSIFDHFGDGLECCSEFPICFGNIHNLTMHVFEYFLYMFRLYGNESYLPKLPNKKINE